MFQSTEAQRSDLQEDVDVIGEYTGVFFAAYAFII